MGKGLLFHLNSQFLPPDIYLKCLGFFKFTWMFHFKANLFRSNRFVRSEDRFHLKVVFDTEFLCASCRVKLGEGVEFYL